MQILQVKTSDDFSNAQVAAGTLLVWPEISEGQATFHCKDENGNVQTIGGSGDSASAFTDLTDTPSSYAGKAKRVPVVKDTEDGLELTGLALPDTATGDADKLVSVEAVAVADTGTGADGDVTISAADTVVNSYTDLTADVSSGSTILAVRDASAFGAGDNILICQSQIYESEDDDDGESKLGLCEFATIESIDENAVTLISGLSRAYYSDNDGNKAYNSKTQIVRVPNYANLTISDGASIAASAWDGYSGGMVVFKVSGTMSGAGGIDAVGKGFRAVYPNGEGWAGRVTGNGTVQLYGGGYDAGGGGHQVAGGKTGGYAFGSLGTLTMGGASGRSPQHGGGIIYTIVNDYQCTGTLNADGGTLGNLNYYDGAGGQVKLGYVTLTVTPTTSVVAGTYNGGGGAGWSGNDELEQPVMTPQWRTVATIVAKILGAASGLELDEGILKLSLKNNFSATAAPTATDDETAGYSIGSRWIDLVTGKAYSCTDASAGEAVWSEGGGAALLTELDDVESDYTGKAKKVPVVKDTEDGIEFTGLSLPDTSSGDVDKLVSVEAVAVADTGTGADGDVTITDSGAVVNVYTDLISDIASGAAVLPVREATGFSANDNVLILQSQSYRGQSAIGLFEFATIESVDGSAITLVGGVVRPYYSDSDGNKINNTKTQIVRVPNYNNLVIDTGASIACKQWDGYSGGIAVFKVKETFSGPGDVNVRSLGYRGYSSISQNANEGWIGNNPDEDDYGGGDYASAGGAHRTLGHTPANGSAQATPFGSPDTLTMGGAGGGHNGSGIIYAIVGTYNLSGTLDTFGQWISGSSVKYYHGGAGQVRVERAVESIVPIINVSSSDAATGLGWESVVGLPEPVIVPQWRTIATIVAKILSAASGLEFDGGILKLSLKNNFSATAAPTVTDDSSAGYAVGSRWIDITNQKAYTCVDATENACVWIEG